MAKATTKKAKAAVPAEVAAKKAELTRRLYDLAGDSAKADEFEAVRVELEALGE